MSFYIADQLSSRAYACAGTLLFFYDGGSDRAGSLVANLKREPNQIQNAFGEKQVVVSFWNEGLVCYGVEKGEVRWKSNEIPRVAQIVYSQESKRYYVSSEDDFKTITCDWLGEPVETHSDYEVSGAFFDGHYVLGKAANGTWRVVSSIDGSIVATTQTPLKNQILRVAGNDTIFGLTEFGGSMEFYDLGSGSSLFRLERQNWFNVSSLIHTTDPKKFRALVGDWDNKPTGAVIEVDVAEKQYQLVAASSDWNWDASLVNDGTAVLRFFEDSFDRFVVTGL